MALGSVLIGLSSTMAAETAATRTGIRLPPPRLDGPVAVEGALAERRSRRHYGRRALTLDEVSQLLWAAQGVTDADGARAAPSAGALYPLEIALVVGKVVGLTAGIYRYEPRGHRLRAVASGDRRRELAAAALDQAWVRRAPAVIVLAGVVERTAARYGSRAERYVLIEAGAAAENVSLQASAMGLGTVMVGAFRDGQVAAITGLAAGERPYLLMPVGAR